jgi:hypothetical protein
MTVDEMKAELRRQGAVWFNNTTLLVLEDFIAAYDAAARSDTAVQYAEALAEHWRETAAATPHKLHKIVAEAKGDTAANIAAAIRKFTQTAPEAPDAS